MTFDKLHSPPRPSLVQTSFLDGGSMSMSMSMSMTSSSSSSSSSSRRRRQQQQQQHTIGTGGSQSNTTTMVMRSTTMSMPQTFVLCVLVFLVVLSNTSNVGVESFVPSSIPSMAAAPQRLHSSTTKTAAAMKNSADGDTNNKSSSKKRKQIHEKENQQRKSRPRRKPKSSSSSSSNSIAKNGPSVETRTLLSHELLTKSEEKVLGQQLQRAIQLKKKVEDLVDARNLRRIEIERNDSEDGEETTVYGGWGDEDDDFVTGSSFRREDDEDEYRYDEFSVSSMYGEEDSYSDFDMESFGVSIDADGRISDEDLANLSIFQGSNDPTRNLEAFELNSLAALDPSLRSDNDSTASDNSLGAFFATDQLKSLTDHEIIHELGIPGGRSELHGIFLKGAEARESLVRGNVKLIMSIAKSWFRRRAGSSKSPKFMSKLYEGSWSVPSLDEVVQEGIVGLSAAADRFEPGRDLKFSTYATYYITNEVRRCFQRASTGSLRIPVNFYDIRTKYNNMIKTHYQTTGKRMKLDDAVTQLGIKPERLSFVLSRTQPLISLDGPVHDGHYSLSGKGGDGEVAKSWSEYILSSDPSPEELLERAILRQCLENAFASELTPHERDVIRLRHGLDDGVPRSASNVSELLGGVVSEWQVRGAERSAYKKLKNRTGIHTRRLHAYFDGLAGAQADQTLAAAGAANDDLLS